MVAIAGSAQVFSSVLPANAVGPGAAGAQSDAIGSAAAAQAGERGAGERGAGDSVALSAIATALTGDAASLFAAFSGDDRQRLAQAVESGAISAEELNDGIVGALKGERKRQLWKLVAEMQQELPARDPTNASLGWSQDVVAELEALGDARGRAMMSMMRLSFEGAPAAAIKEQAEELQQIESRQEALSQAVSRDMMQPKTMTMIGAGGQFFSANWQSGAENAGLDKMSARGTLSDSMRRVIAAAARADAADNLIVRTVDWKPGGVL